MMSNLTKRMATSVMIVAALGTLAGCRNVMPHSFTWPATGDTIPTHPKPPEGGYYTNWDPYAAELTVEHVGSDINPVQTQHVLVATVRDSEGKPLPNRRIEWILSEGSIGDIVEVDESGFRASRGYKVDNSFAVSHTNNFSHVLDRGNDDPSDDIALEKGQSWCVITSPIEGETYITAYCPAIYDWSKHKVFLTKKWQDVAWQCPEPATNPVGTQHEFVTWVGKHSDGTPLQGYEVTYQIMDGPAATFVNGGTSTTVTTDASGYARVTLQQTQEVEGTNNVQIDIVKPENVTCCKPPVHIATCNTSKTWLAPSIGITKDCTPRALVGEQFTYNIRVFNDSQIAAEDVTVTDNLPDGISYVSSNPSSNGGGSALSWSLGSVGGGESRDIQVTVTGSRTGTFTNCAEVRTRRGLNARDCCDTVITSPALALEKTCPAEVTTCDTITYTLTVRNTGDGPANNVRVTDNLPDGIVTNDGRRTVTFDAGTLEPGQAKKADITVRAERTGTFNNVATAEADGGLTAQASCTTIVRQPVLTVSKQGPPQRYIGRPGDYAITVTNTGDSPAQNTQLVDTMPPGTSFVSASDGGVSSGNSVTWNMGTLNPGESRTVNLTLKFNSAGDVRNTARATAVCAEASDSTETPVRGIPAVLLEVIDIDDPVEVGSQTTYVITVTNQGSADDTNIRIVATLPPQEEFISASGATNATTTGQTISFAPLPSLAPKAKASWQIVIRAGSAGDVRFAVEMNTDNLTSPVNETESTNLY